MDNVHGNAAARGGQAGSSFTVQVKSWDVIIVGGGIIGLSLSVVRKRGASVLVVERGNQGARRPMRRDAGELRRRNTRAVASSSHGQSRCTRNSCELRMSRPERRPARLRNAAISADRTKSR
jgi:glycine/D-amino acid oxidase-like deaminating enzyme